MTVYSSVRIQTQARQLRGECAFQNAILVSHFTTVKCTYSIVCMYNTKGIQQLHTVHHVLQKQLRWTFICQMNLALASINKENVLICPI